MKASITSALVALALYLLAGAIAAAFTSGFVTFLLGGLFLFLACRFADALEDSLD